MSDHPDFGLSAEEVHQYDQAFAESETALGMLIAGYLDRIDDCASQGIPESAVVVTLSQFLETWGEAPLSSVLAVAVVCLARRYRADEAADGAA